MRRGKTLSWWWCAALAAGCTAGADTGRSLASPTGDAGLPSMPTADAGLLDPAGTPQTEGDTVFDHPATLGGPATDLQEMLGRAREEGPADYRARVHSCRKMRYRTIGRILGSFGVDLTATEPDSAGRMWREADQALGSPNYAARIPESAELTVATSARLFDILVQAAPEIIENLSQQERCRIGGVGVRVFDSMGRCERDGLSCLLGIPASDVHVALCNDVVGRAPTQDEGQRIAVASLLAASMTCE